MSQLDEFQKLEDLIKSVYLIADEGIIKFIAACIISHRLPADPTWSFLVSAPSGGKTELLNAVSKVEGIYPISALTPHTFLSGMKRDGRETSLLSRLKNGILTFKDFTSVLSMNPDARSELFGQFREIYDGKISKEFGTGETKSWQGKMSFLAGVTTEIHLSRELYSSMGERFTLYNIEQPDRKEGTKRAIANARSMKMKETREHIQDEFKRFMDETLVIPEVMPQLPESLESYLQDLAELSTRAGTKVVRDWRSQSKEISFVHDPTMPFRFATCLINYGTSLMVLNDGPLTPKDENIIFKVALDSIDKNRRIVLQELTRYSEVDTKSLAMELHRPTPTVRRICEDLDALEMIDRTTQKNKDKWVLKEEYRKILSKFEHIEMLEAKLEDEVPGEVESVFPGAELIEQ